MTTALGHRTAVSGDVPFLARMNQELIADEGHRNSMNLTELETRMRSMLDGDYTATLFEVHGQDVAYALWRIEPEWVYIRQFFVVRDHRRRGIGRQVIRELVDEIWPVGRRIRVDALIGNQPALEFWRAVGFADYLIALELERSGR